MTQFKTTLNIKNIQFDPRFPRFNGLHSRTHKLIKVAHEQRETWIQANFENIDPKFHKKMKEKEK